MKEVIIIKKEYDETKDELDNLNTILTNIQKDYRLYQVLSIEKSAYRVVTLQLLVERK